MRSQNISVTEYEICHQRVLNPFKLFIEKKNNIATNGPVVPINGTKILLFWLLEAYVIYNEVIFKTCLNGFTHFQDFDTLLGVVTKNHICRRLRLSPHFYITLKHKLLNNQFRLDFRKNSTIYKCLHRFTYSYCVIEHGT